MKRLYKVTLEIDSWFISDTCPDEFVALYYDGRDAIKEEVIMNGVGDKHPIVSEVTDVSQVPENIRDTIPFGDNDKALTFQEWFEKRTLEIKQMEAR